MSINKDSIHQKVAAGNADPNLGVSVGDLITTYHKGYHVVTEVELRWNDNQTPNTSLIHYYRIMGEGGKKSGKRKNACDASWCEVVDRVSNVATKDSLIDEIEAKHQMIDDCLLQLVQLVQLAKDKNNGN